LKLLTHTGLLIRRICYALIFFALGRLLFFLMNADAFAPSGFSKVIGTFFYGLLFDFSAIAYLNTLFYILSIIPWHLRSKHAYQKVLRIQFLLMNSVALLLNCIDSAFFRFSGKRSGTELLQLKDDILPLLGNYLFDYWYLLLGFFILCYLMWKFYPVSHEQAGSPYNGKQYTQHSLLMLAMLGLWVILARGGFYLKPIRPFDAGRFVSSSLIPLTLNTPFQFISTLENKAVPVPEYFPEKELQQLYSFNKQYASGLPFQKKNVVVIILESFGKEYVGYCNNGIGYTPFLDSLSQHSIVFQNAFANGKKSIEALPAILSSVPSLLDVPFINSPYQSNRLSGLGRILQAEGYQSAFYHGARNGTMGFDAFIGASGFGKYYGMNEYPDKSDYDGHWGIFDEPFMQFALKGFSGMKQPFCGVVFTLSSHHPYTIPKQLKGYFPKGKLEIHESIGYADYALRRFFETASAQPWFAQTIFLITADHSAVSSEKRYQSMAGKYEVPLLLFDPSQKEARIINKLTAHTDLLPTILHYLHYPRLIHAFGASAFDSSQAGTVMHLESGVYQLIIMPYVLHFDGQKTTGVYDYVSDPVMKQNIMSSIGPDTLHQLENKMKAGLQLYLQKLNSNKLTD
jgi:phosphoglycerol transferase MdoB-like AlkP superfamily enzyme